MISNTDVVPYKKPKQKKLRAPQKGVFKSIRAMDLYEESMENSDHPTTDEPSASEQHEKSVQTVATKTVDTGTVPDQLTLRHKPDEHCAAEQLDRSIQTVVSETVEKGTVPHPLTLTHINEVHFADDDVKKQMLAFVDWLENGQDKDMGRAEQLLFPDIPKQFNPL